MKILLVVPKYTYGNFTPKRNYHYWFPIGPAYISAVLKKEGFDYDCVNMNHEDGTIVEIVGRALDRKKYDVVCTGDMALGFVVIEKIIKAVREHRSNPKIIIGGAVITSEPELMTKNLDYDYGVIGEGEITIIDLLKCIEKKGDAEKVDGICFKKDGKVVITKPREVITNLDELPFADYESLGYGEYLDNACSTDAHFGFLDYPRLYPLVASRGCPNQCTFCYHSLGPKYRFRSIDNVMEEIEYAIKKFNINSVMVLDDLFAYNQERIYDFCGRMKKLGERIEGGFKWACQISVNFVDKKLLETMKDSGCVWISWGFETYSDRVLKSMKKPITPEQIKKAIRWCLEIGMGIEGGFIFGDSAETHETKKETLDFWKKECQGQVTLFFIQPYPGSVMYRRAVQKGVLKDKIKFIRDDIYRTNFFNMTDSMSDDEYKKMVKEVLKLRSNGCRYVVPSKLKKEKKDIYEVVVRCPFCKKQNRYKNSYIANPRYYTLYSLCRHCVKKYYIVSKLYKFTSDYYFLLDPLRRGYLLLRKKISDKKV